jgi:hypothetical protein
VLNERYALIVVCDRTWKPFPPAENHTGKPLPRLFDPRKRGDAKSRCRCSSDDRRGWSGAGLCRRHTGARSRFADPAADAAQRFTRIPCGDSNDKETLPRFVSALRAIVPDAGARGNIICQGRPMQAGSKLNPSAFDLFK